MQKTLIILFVMFGLTSCNFRIFINEKYDHKADGLNFKVDSATTSYVMLDTSQRLPDSSVFVNETEILSPMIWLTERSLNYGFANQARKEAKRVGANVIKIAIRHYVGKGFSRAKFTVDMYNLPEPYFTMYNGFKDSVKLLEKKQSEKFVILHLIGVDGSCNLYYNDSLLRHFTKPVKEKGAYAFHTQDMRFDHSGILSFVINGAKKHKRGVILNRGEEYWLAVAYGKYDGGHGYYFISPNKKDINYLDVQNSH